MPRSFSPLASQLRRELDEPAGAAAQAVAEEIRRRHGSAVAAILFYGSCLRRRTPEGVLDFYVLVDGYRAAYRSRRLALLNALLPPNVIYCELSAGHDPLRAKYAVMTTRRFLRAASGSGIDTRVWARFSQPAALVYARDAAARDAVLAAAEAATLALVERASAWLPAAPFRAAELWATGFAQTYRAELRSEGEPAICALHEHAPERFESVAREALRELARRGRLRLHEQGECFAAEWSGLRRARLRLAWRLRRPLAKGLAVLGLVKTAGTFGDWVPYVLWKVERHSGVHVEVNERQRRHPLIFGWPVLFRLLRQRALR